MTDRSEQANERTPLNNSSNEVYGTRPNVEREFQDALNEEEPGTTFYDVIVKRPTTVIVALCLFALLALVSYSITSIDTSELIEMARNVTTIEPRGVELVGISNNKIEIESRATVLLNYSKLGTGLANRVAASLGRKLSFIEVKLEGPVVIRTKLDDEWKYLISLNSRDSLHVSLKEEPQELNFSAYLTDVGRTDVIGSLMHKALQNSPIDIKAEGSLIVSKYGINNKLDFMLTHQVTIPSRMTDDFAQLSRVIVKTDHSHGIEITALANATVEEPLMLAAKFPSMHWNVKIPGCDENRLELAATGTSQEFDLSPESTAIEVYFLSLINRLPANIVDTCYQNSDVNEHLGATYKLGSNEKSELQTSGLESSELAPGEYFKSPLDKWLSNYLTGKPSIFYVEGQSSPDQPQIVNDLLTGYDIPYYVFGKPDSEKLIQNITIEDVKFSNGILFKDLNTMQFSGRVLVDVVLPKFLEMAEAKTAVMVTAIKGTIQLFKDNDINLYRNEHFAQIIAEDWLETITLSYGDGYKVTCYFDNLPMDITNSEAFTRVSNEMLFTGHSEILYDAVVDIDFETLVGSFVSQKIHIKGKTDMRAK